jgi:uncharacterized membrane protein
MFNRKSAIFNLLLVLWLLATPAIALAQAPVPTLAPAPTTPALIFYTPYPSQIAGLGGTVSIDLHLMSTVNPQTAALAMKDIPQGWSADFQGGSTTIQSVYLPADADTTVSLRLTQPADVKAGKYEFTVTATGSNNMNASLPIELVIQEKLPPKLTFTCDLPTLTGGTSTTFTYSVTLKNDGDEDLTTALSADTSNMFNVTFQYTGQNITSLPIAAHDSKSLTVTATSINDLQAASYPINLHAQGGSAAATFTLTAQVTGTTSLSLTTPDGTLSGQIYSGSQTPLKLDLKNTGTSDASQITLSSSAPTGWTVTFSPATIQTLAANQQQEVTVNVQPADKAVAGDYMITFTATPGQGAAKSVDYRVTVLTSTLWGIVGVALVAVAVVVVAVAVMRFGRR